MRKDVKAVLTERRSQYGDFKDVAKTTQKLYNTLSKGKTFSSLDAGDQVALYMVCNKLARLVNGSLKDDTLLDIQGYVQLMRKEGISG